MLREHDRIVLTQDLPDDGLQAGDVGTAVHSEELRLLVIVTATSEISGQEPLVAAAVTSRFREPLDEDDVCFPGILPATFARSSESLAWRSAAGCARLP